MSKTLGIILAAGRSSRLYPATLASTKQLLPIYDKPLIYYPLSTLMLAGIRDFLIITNPDEQPQFEKLLSSGLGINIMFAVQESPKGIADAFRIAELALHNRLDEFDRVALILGDNIFYGSAMTAFLQEAVNSEDAVVFATKVHDPERFGVVEVDENGKALSLEEKPDHPKSNLAVTGLYFYPMDVLNTSYNIRPSARGELEITDLNKVYLENQRLSVKKMLRGMVWFDTGTPDSMMEASQFIQTLQKTQDILIGSPHEIAYNNNWLDKHELLNICALCGKSAYGKYLLGMVE